ncbi:MAG: uracil-DNA glycosylase family protein [bacterium]
MPDTNVDVIERTKELADRVDDITIDDKLGWSYNPLQYAWDVHRAYIGKYGSDKKRAVYLGMNPGPWGMGQTGVPFGDPFIVGDDMGFRGINVDNPENEREEREVLGWESDREEGSGQRLYSYFKDQYGSLDAFFEDQFIINYCPLLMFTPDGNNLTPSNLLKADRLKIYEACDPYLNDMIESYEPEVLVGIGKFALERLEAVAGESSIPIMDIPHPSPASPIATRDGGQYWINLVTETLSEHNLLDH